MQRNLGFTLLCLCLTSAAYAAPPERIYVDDTRFHFVTPLPVDADLKALLDALPYTVVADGMALLTETMAAPTAPAPGLIPEESDDVWLAPRIPAGLMLTADGQQHRLTGVNLAAVDATVALYEAYIVARTGGPEPGVTADDAIDPPLSPTTHGAILTAVTVDGPGSVAQIVGIEDRTLVIGTGQPPYNKVVRYGNQCSGTLYGRRHLAIAAHCVFDTDRDVWYRPTFACIKGRDGSSPHPKCAQALAQVITGGYWLGGTGDIKNDYAIVILDRDLVPAADVMLLSRLNTQGTLLPRNYVNLGYPNYRPDTGAVNMGPLLPAGQRSRLFEAHGGGISLDNRVLRTTLDTSIGHSGGPIFYYSDGSFTFTGQSHFQTAIMSAIFPSTGTNGGPTIAPIRAWLLSALP